MGQRGVEVSRPKKTGKQNIVKANDYGARKVWADSHNPENVNGMVGKAGEFAKYKHREGNAK